MLVVVCKFVLAANPTGGGGQLSFRLPFPGSYAGSGAIEGGRLKAIMQIKSSQQILHVDVLLPDCKMTNFDRLFCRIS